VRTRPPNRLVAAAVLGVMVLMAAGGLTLALLTQKDRRANDTGLTRRPNRPPPRQAEPPVEVPVTAAAPDRLEALGYLPPGTSVIAGVHVAELLGSKAGRALLEDPVKAGALDVRLAGVKQWTGVELEQLDHLVLGFKADEPLPPPSLTLVVRTRGPYNADKVREALKAHRLPGGKRQLYSFEAQNLRLPLVLWCADERTVVVGLRDAQMAQVPLTPVQGLGRLTAEVRTALTERRLGPGGPLWAVGHSRNWADTAAFALFPRLKEDDRKRFQAAQTVAAQVQLEPEVRVQAAFHCTEEAAARGLDRYFRDPGRAGPQLTTVRDDTWLTLQLKTDLDAVRRALGK
jgi:hypothetical protein